MRQKVSLTFEYDVVHGPRAKLARLSIQVAGPDMVGAGKLNGLSEPPSGPDLGNPCRVGLRCSSYPCRVVGC